MRIIIFLLVALSCLMAADAQVPPKTSMNAEMQQQILEMKKDISTLEKEIKEMEKTDPAEAASMKKELAALKNMLAMLENIGKPPPPVKKTAPVKPAVLQNSVSPIEPLVIKQPITVPTAAQATDRLLWYKGKKINDTTLVTVKGMVVQYNKNNKTRSRVKILPPKKTDPFDSMAVELTKTPQRKQALIAQFSKMQNGFTYYPELKRTLEIYDYLEKQYFDIFKNTIDLPTLQELNVKTNALVQPDGGSVASRLYTGHDLPLTTDHSDDAGGAAPAELDSGDELHLDLFGEAPDIDIEAMKQLARKLFNELPPESSFPPPPKHERGLCNTCDPDLIRKQKESDGIWKDQYMGAEQKISAILLGIERQYALLGAESEDSDLFQKIFNRMNTKNKILFDKYGNDLTHMEIVNMVILGYERQKQLLGMGAEDESVGLAEVAENINLYDKYLDEQIEAKNHDFVLNLSSHLGVERQRQLLGVNNGEGKSLNDVITFFSKYNRFELILESDFIVEDKTENNELEFKATGAMATKEKIYGMFIMDSCRYKMIPHQIDLFSTKLGDISIPFQVKSGVKTIKDDEGKLVNYNYSGPDTYALTFPIIKIDFCGKNDTDTAWFYTFQIIEGTPGGSTADLLYQTRKSYKTEFLLMANFIFVTNELQRNEDDFLNVSQDVFKTIGEFQNADDGGSDLEKMRLQYEGKRAMDDQANNLQGLANDKKSVVVFTANNKQTVLADKYTDTKRKLEEEGLNLVRGMMHLKILHSPLK
jgi:hypothetical protein